MAAPPVVGRGGSMNAIVKKIKVPPHGGEVGVMMPIVQQTRMLPLLLGAACLLVANRLWEVDRLFTDDPFFPWLWPWWLLTAGLSCWAYAIWPYNRHLLAWSGALTASGFIARSIAVALGLFDGNGSLSSPQAHLAGAVYMICGCLVAYTWIQVMRPATTLLIKERIRAAERTEKWTGT